MTAVSHASAVRAPLNSRPSISEQLSHFAARSSPPSWPSSSTVSGTPGRDVRYHPVALPPFLLFQLLAERFSAAPAESDDQETARVLVEAVGEGGDVQW